MDAREHPRHRHIREATQRPLEWRVFGEFQKATHLHRQLMSHLLAERDIPPAQALCIRALGHNDGVSQRDLADLLGVSRPTVTVMLQKMERTGLIRRETDQEDQRYTRIYLTEAGWAAHEDMHRLLGEFIEGLIGPLCETDREELARLLGLLNANMAAALGDRPHGPHRCHTNLFEEDGPR